MNDLLGCSLSVPTIWLATYAVIVAVKVGAVARLTASYWRSACGTCLCTIAECASCWAKTLWRKTGRMSGRTAAWSARRSRAAMTVVVTGFSIGVAALSIEATAMREHDAGRAKSNNDCEDKYQMH